MEIFRTIHGRPYCFTLTSHELKQAHREQVHQYDLDRLHNRPEALSLDEETLDTVAWEARRQINKYGLDFDCAVDEALFDLGLT